MNRRELLAAAIAAAVVPGELVAEPVELVEVVTDSQVWAIDHRLFLSHTLQSIADALTIPYEELTRQVGQIGYSSARAVLEHGRY